MKKREFLQQLKKGLRILEEKEVEDILKEYDGYIEEKIANGKSETEAVASFGDVTELTNELLKAYKIKTKEPEDPIGHFASKVISNIDTLINDFNHKSTKEIIKFVVEIVVIFGFIILCHIPVSFLVSFGANVFGILSSPLNRIFYTAWQFVLEFAYFILAIVVFSRIFKIRYLKDEGTEKKVKKKEKKLPKEEKNVSFMTSFSETIIKIVVFFLKFLAICILFIVSLYLIIMAIMVFLCLYLLIKGVTYFGFYLVMLSLFILGVIFFGILFNFVIDRKNKGLSLAISLLISFVLLGVGCGVATLEVAQTTFYNSPPEDLVIDVLKEELVMEKDTVFIGNISDYKVDNTLENVLVEYKYYPLGNQMATKISKNENYVYLDWSIEKIYLKQELIDHFIEDLKMKKVYNYYIEPTIVITANEKNIEQIKKNRREYYENENDYTSCEFTRTYYVEMMRKSELEDEYYVVLSDGLKTFLTTTTVSSSLGKNLEVGKYFEFTFKTYQAYIDTDIENIFADNEVVAIKKSDKEIDEQINEDTCSVFY